MEIAWKVIILFTIYLNITFMHCSAKIYYLVLLALLIFIQFSSYLIHVHNLRLFLAEENALLLVIKGAQIVDVSLTPGDRTSGFLVPVVGINVGVQVEYDRKSEKLFWVESKEEESDNVSKQNKLK